MLPDRRQRGTLIISLDFELLWGLADIVEHQAFMTPAAETRRAIPQILELFDEFQIHASWATVGFLFFGQRQDLLAHLPEHRPDYHDWKLSTYAHLATVGADEEEDPAHFGLSLIRIIQAAPNQEIASHTFSHYYCLEPGQTAEAFQHDLLAARKVAARHDINLTSLVFPRNQVNPNYLNFLSHAGIKGYRGIAVGNELSQAIKGLPGPVVRGYRLLDTYIRLSGHNAFNIWHAPPSLPMNIPASRFLRPWSILGIPFEPLRLHRISSSLEFAARNDLAYHLWWHPHNFAAAVDQNLSFLRKILEKFSTLRERYGMESLNMGEVVERVNSAANDPSADLQH